MINLSVNDYQKIPVDQRNGIYKMKNIEGGIAIYYHVNGKLHRLDGPAIYDELFYLGEFSDSYTEYWIEGKQYSIEEFEKEVRIIEMRTASGNFTSNDLVTSFIYSLARDYLPIGVIEEIMNTCTSEKCVYTNGWLAKYAEDISKRLNGSPTT